MGKVRVSLSLEESIVKKLDAAAAGGSRSAAVEKALEQFLGRELKAVILAGGEPKNLVVPSLGVYRPLTRINHATLVEDIVAKAGKAGASRIFLAGSHEINSRVFEKIGARVEYVEEKEHLGSAHTLKLVEEKLYGTFLFLPCDHFFDFDLRRIREFHEKSGFVATLAVHAGGAYEWSKTSLVRMDGNKIVEYWEKPERQESHLTATLIGFAEKEFFEFVPEKGSLEGVFAKLARKGLLGGFVVSGNFVNVHEKKDLENVKKILG